MMKGMVRFMTKQSLGKLSILVCTVFLFSFYFGNLFSFAIYNNDFNDKNIKVLQNTANTIKIVGEYKGDLVYATMDKKTREITMQTVEKPKNNLKGLFSKEKDKISNYKVKVQKADGEDVEASFLELETKKEYKIGKSSSDKVVAQAVIAVPLINIVGGWLIRYLMALFFSVVIGGMTYVVASEIAQTLRDKKQYNYYYATLRNNKVYIGSAYPNDGTAFAAVRGGSNLFAISDAKANEAARKGGNGNATHHLAHGGGDGYWNHWHPMSGTSLGKQHCWY